MRKVFITGITGFAGSFLAEHLLKQDYEVHGTYLDEGSLTQVEEFKQNLKLYKINLLQKEDIDNLILELKPDEIYHLAALTSPAQSFKMPTQTISNNANAQIYLFESVIKAGITPKILVVSSADIYGLVEEKDLPISEDTPLNPSNPYAVSKITQDYLALSYYNFTNLPIVRVRPFNHIGPRQAPSFVAPDFAKQIAEIERGIKPPIIKVGNLEAKRDFTDVRDMVRAYQLALTLGKPGDVYNIGSGKSLQIGDILKILLSFSNISIKTEKDKNLVRSIDTKNRICDVTKFKNLTHWDTKIPLEQSLLDLLNYWRKKV